MYVYKIIEASNFSTVLYPQYKAIRLPYTAPPNTWSDSNLHPLLPPQPHTYKILILHRPAEMSFTLKKTLSPPANWARLNFSSDLPHSLQIPTFCSNSLTNQYSTFYELQLNSPPPHCTVVLLAHLGLTHFFPPKAPST